MENAKEFILLRVAYPTKDGRIEAARQAKVGKLDLEVRTDEHVARLDAAVHIVLGVHACQDAEQLANHALDLHLRELVGHVDEVREAVRDILKHEKQVTLEAFPGIYGSVLLTLQT